MRENTIFHTNEIWKESSANELRCWLERCCIAKRIVNFDTYEVNGDGSRRTCFDIERNQKDALKYFYESSLHWSSSFGRFLSQYGSSRRVHEKVQEEGFSSSSLLQKENERRSTYHKLWYVFFLEKERVKRTFTRLLRVPLLKTKLVSILNQATVTNLTNASTIDAGAAYATMQDAWKYHLSHKRNMQRIFSQWTSVLAWTMLHRETYCQFWHIRSQWRWLTSKHVLTLSAIQKTHSNTSMRVPTLIVFLLEDFSVSTEAQEECMKKVQEEDSLLLLFYKKRMNDDQHITSCDYVFFLEKEGWKERLHVYFESLSWKRNCFKFESSNCHEFDEC